MFFNYPEEYSVPVNYSDNLIEKNNEKEEKFNVEIEREKGLLREFDPFSEKIEYKENDLEKSEGKIEEAILKEVDEEYINDEIKYINN